MSPINNDLPAVMTFSNLRERIVKRELTFPPQVERLAALYFARPELPAFEPAVEIAAQANVPKSTVARFVKLLGKSRLNEAPQIFRDELRRRARSK